MNSGAGVRTSLDIRVHTMPEVLVFPAAASLQMGSATGFSHGISLP